MRSTPACGNAWRGSPTWNISGNPVPGCWTVHRDEAGAWITDHAWPDPEPAPFTTIGWRLVHIADCKVMYHEWAFGPGKLTFPDLTASPAAADAIARLEEGQ
jgi:hypothetical protein